MVNAILHLDWTIQLFNMVREKVTINLTTKKSDKIVKPAAKLKNITKGKKKPKERVHN